MPETSYDLYGRFDHNLDDKGRLLIPNALKERLGTDVVTTMGAGKHARIYPKQMWREIQATLSQKKPLDAFEKHRMFMQRLHNTCEHGAVDNNGRLTVPRFIRDWIGVKESTPAILIGNENWIEIWSVAGWEAYMISYTEDIVDAASSNLEVGAVAFPAPESDNASTPQAE